MSKVFSTLTLVIFALLLGNVQVSAQYVEEYLDQIQQGQYEKARAALPQLLQEHPNDPGVLYLQGLLESDGEKAYTIYKDLADNHRGHPYRDDAIMQVAEYLYARGLYISAEKYLRRIPIHHPRSPYMERAVNMLINSMMQAGKVDSARTWKRVLARQFPEIKLNADVDQPAKKVNEDSLAAMAPPEPVDLSKENPFVDASEADTQFAETEKKPQTAKQPEQKRFTLQVGAFSTMENARSQKDLFESYGYPVQIRKRQRGNLQLYLVWVGQYDTRSEAERAGQTIQQRVNLPYFIVDTNL
ncbi:MAG: Outer membrane protein assembly factor BamD [Candidatus Marinimicrobia bacterium]|nr:Outer membrane protein assembly factor BamD [Candidatus Neomarinimicrobiota bacterium]